MLVLGSALAAAFGMFLWFFMEYVLHRFAFHEMRGKGIGSREHLDHHVRASWVFDPMILLAWLGVVLVGVGLGALGWMAVDRWIGIALGAGYVYGYFFYEWHHRAAHLRGPRNQWEAWLRKHHFHHHFGHPLHNQGVTIGMWDHVFGTYDRPDKVQVPRRLVMPWLVDEHGEVKPEYAADYELVGTTGHDERQAALDKARAYANLVPIP